MQNPVLNSKFVPITLYLAFTIALASTLGSLYFSEIVHFPPCVLCWYQRIAMYPLAVIFAVGISKKDLAARLYAGPFVIVGWIIAMYHNLLYYNILPEAVAPCRAGISCTTKFIEWGGFVSIPLLALLGFTVIGILLLWPHQNKQPM